MPVALPTPYSLLPTPYLLLTLSLFVLGIDADDANNALTPNHFALLAHFFNRCTNFHGVAPKKTRWKTALTVYTIITPCEGFQTQKDGRRKKIFVLPFPSLPNRDKL